MTTLDTARLVTQAGILQRFADKYQQAEAVAAARTQDPDARRLAAGRIALEYAVMKTAMEKETPSHVVANALASAPPQVQATMVNKGREAMRQAYGHEPDLIASALAGKIVEVPLPKGFASNPEFDRLIDSARNLVATATQQSYSDRGRLVQFGGHRDDVVGLRADSALASTRSELANRLAFIEGAIDARVARGAMDTGAAAMLKERVEAFVFQPRPPQSLSYTPQFLAFYESEGKAMRAEVMKEVRAVTQSRTIHEIGAKLDQTFRASPVRNHEELAR